MKYDGDYRLRLENKDIVEFKEKAKKKKKKPANLVRKFIKSWNKRN